MLMYSTCRWLSELISHEQWWRENVNGHIYSNWSGTLCLHCVFCDANGLIEGFACKVVQGRHTYILPCHYLPQLHLLNGNAAPGECLSSDLWCTPSQWSYDNSAGLHACNWLFIGIIWHQVSSCLNRVQKKGDGENVEWKL